MMDRILVIEDDGTLRQSLELMLATNGYNVRGVSSADSALDALEKSPVDVAFCGIHMQGLDAFDLIPQIQRVIPRLPVVLLSAGDRAGAQRGALERGAYTALHAPIEASELLLLLAQLKERDHLLRHNEILRRDIARSVGERAIVAASDGMIDLLEMLDRTAGYKSTVLVTGEPGTGKEIIARAIHAQSPRRESPFVAFDCVAVSPNQAEAVLFGHSHAAFPGAGRAGRGLFAKADQGTLFLDEIANLAISTQVALLRAIQDEEVFPVGESKGTSVDVRVIASSTRDLEHEIAEGRFREDLFCRLNVVRLDVPPLRERRQDIPLLVDHFLAKFRDQLGKPVRHVSDEALELLVGHRWTGNVRELENAIERALILAEGDTLEPDDLAKAVRLQNDTEGTGDDGEEDLTLKRARHLFEAGIIRKALVRTGGNRTHAAKVLGISHRALLYKIKDYGLRD